MPSVFEPPDEAAAPEASHTATRRLVDLILGAAFGCGAAAALFAKAWWEEDARESWWGSNSEFSQIVIGATVVGIATLISIWPLVRRAGGRVTHWLAAAAAFWFSCDYAVRLGPAMDRFTDPREFIAIGALFGTTASCAASVPGFIDWFIQRNVRRSLERERSHG